VLAPVPREVVVALHSQVKLSSRAAAARPSKHSAELGVKIYGVELDVKIYGAELGVKIYDAELSAMSSPRLCLVQECGASNDGAETCK